MYIHFTQSELIGGVLSCIHNIISIPIEDSYVLCHTDCIPQSQGTPLC